MCIHGTSVLVWWLLSREHRCVDMRTRKPHAPAGLGLIFLVRPADPTEAAQWGPWPRAHEAPGWGPGVLPRFPRLGVLGAHSSCAGLQCSGCRNPVLPQHTRLCHSTPPLSLPPPPEPCAGGGAPARKSAVNFWRCFNFLKAPRRCFALRKPTNIG